MAGRDNKTKLGKIRNYEFRLGNKSTIFYDSVTGLKLTPGVTKTLRTSISGRIGKAIAGGHILYKEILDAEVKSKAEEDEGTELDINKMNTTQLLEYYTSNFEVDEVDLKAFNDLKVDEKRAFLKQAEEEAGDEE